MRKRQVKRILSLVLSTVLCATAMPSVVYGAKEEARKLIYDISFEENHTGNMNFGENNDQKMRGQTFVAVNGGNIKSIDVNIGRVPGTEGDVTAELYKFDLDRMEPTGDPLASATVDKENVVAFDLQSESGTGLVTIPLEYEGLEEGQMYLVRLGQEEGFLTGGYRWSTSCDITNPDWWHDDVWNPQVSQAGYEGELPSLKFTKDGEIVDESRCGDYWMKVNYGRIYTYDLSFEEHDYQTGNLNFGESGDQFMRGQTFVALEGGDLKEIEVSIGRTSQAKGDVLAELYAFDVDKNEPTGECLASATLSKDEVTAFNMSTETGVGHVKIPLKYNGLIEGQMYIVKLGQTGEPTANGFRWSASSDVSNPNWWHDDVWNPQVSQYGYEGELTSLKFGRGGEITDESRCGDLWLKVYYESEYDLDGGEDPGPGPEVNDDGPGLNLEERFQKDMENGGESFYMDRVLARTGVDPTLIEDSGIMTRGRALYTKGSNSSGLIKDFGFGGTMRYVKGDQPGYTILVNGQKAEGFTEETAKRTDSPSHWTSIYRGKAGSADAGLQVVQKRFITDYNVAVTVLELKNTTQEEKNVTLEVRTGDKFSVLDERTLGGEIYVDGRLIDVKLTADDTLVKDGVLTGEVVVPANGTVSWKAQMGFVDPKSGAALAEYDAYCAYGPEEAFLNHIRDYNYWWVENIPYVEVPDEAIQKMIAYRWWIARFNMADMSSTNYPFPTSMEGVFGYNNAIINAVPWQIEEMRYLRSPLAGYGTWATAAFQANGGIYVDNRAGLWSETPQHYISQAGWENYKVHGGQLSFLEAMADAGAGDVMGTQEKYDADKNYLYDIQYDAWDADTVSLAYPHPDFPGDRHYSAAQERIDTAAFAWTNAVAVSEMYKASGNTAQAEQYETLAKNIKNALLENNWDADSRQFLMKFKDEEEFNPLRDINNYYVFMTGMVPQGENYEEALRVWDDEEEFPAWPMYISNSKDYYITANSSELNSRSRNYSPGSLSLTLKMFASVIKNYETDYIDGEAYAELLKNYTNISYYHGNMKYPDVNEFFNNPDGDVPENGHYRSWIHHNWHSQYNTRIIEDVIGITPRDDKVFELNPIDVGWDSFTLENISYHGSDITVKWNRETGYELYVDGVKAAAVDRLAHFTWDAKTGKVEILDNSKAKVLTEGMADGFKSAYDVTYEEGRVADVMKAAADYQPGDVIIEEEEYPYQTGEKPEYNGTYQIYAPNWEANAELGFGNNNSGDEYKRSQEFAALEDGTMTGVQVLIRRKAATADVTVEIWSSDENGMPGERLAGTTVPRESVRSDYMTKVNVPLSCELEAGKNYYIVLGQAEGGNGDYVWALSSKHIGNLQTIVQGSQAGYEGEPKLVKIQASGKRVDESQLGDHYLEVYYKKADQPVKPFVWEIFTDVSEEDWFADYVQYVYDHELMKGMSETCFGSEVSLNRADFAVILHRMEGSPEVKYENRFSDVEDNEYYTDAVLWASSSEVGVICGYTEGPLQGKFGPADPLTREQMATMLYRYAKYKGEDVSAVSELDEFPDKEAVSAFAYQAMSWAVERGLVKGDQGKLNPRNEVNRVVAATIIQRYMDSSAD